jgi:hypothetical protein
VSAPRCRKCGKPLRKLIRTLGVRNEEMAARNVMGSEALTVAKLPRTKEEAARLTNWQVTRVDRLSSGQSDPGGIFQIHGWDGESYERRYRHFCTVKCAALFGQIMADGEL